jgi:hypothetical protein
MESSQDDRAILQLPLPPKLNVETERSFPNLFQGKSRCQKRSFVSTISCLRTTKTQHLRSFLDLVQTEKYREM